MLRNEVYGLEDGWMFYDRDGARMHVLFLSRLSWNGRSSRLCVPKEGEGDSTHIKRIGRGLENRQYRSTAGFRRNQMKRERVPLGRCQIFVIQVNASTGFWCNVTDAWQKKEWNGAIAHRAVACIDHQGYFPHSNSNARPTPFSRGQGF